MSLIIIFHLQRFILIKTYKCAVARLSILVTAARCCRRYSEVVQHFSYVFRWFWICRRLFHFFISALFSKIFFFRFKKAKAARIAFWGSDFIHSVWYSYEDERTSVFFISLYRDAFLFSLSFILLLIQRFVVHPQDTRFRKVPEKFERKFWVCFIFR